MNKMVFGCLSVCFALPLIAGCAGQLANPDDFTTLTSGGSSTGVGGSGSGVDSCVLTSMKSCQTLGCHSGATLGAGLSLATEVLTTNYAALVDAPNKGDPMVAGSCTPPMFNFKLVDSKAPEQSLIYTKLQATPPCGGKMPIIGTFTDTDKACVLRWIKSIPGVGTGSTGSGGACGSTGSDGG